MPGLKSIGSAIAMKSQNGTVNEQGASQGSTAPEPLTSPCITIKKPKPSMEPRTDKAANSSVPYASIVVQSCLKTANHPVVLGDMSELGLVMLVILIKYF